jgi:hypothetical protein
MKICKECGAEATEAASFKLNNLWYCHNCFRDKTNNNTQIEEYNGRGPRCFRN